VRLQTACERIANIKMLAKMNGAVGNYNAHLSAWPTLTGKLSAKRSSRHLSLWAWV